MILSSCNISITEQIWKYSPLSKVELGMGRSWKCPSQLWVGGDGSMLARAEGKPLLLGLPFSRVLGVQLGTKNGEV